MNGKKAKALRRQARSLMAGKGNTTYCVTHPCRKGIPPVPGKHEGYSPEFFQKQGGTVELKYNCERYVYQKLKGAQ